MRCSSSAEQGQCVPHAQTDRRRTDRWASEARYGRCEARRRSSPTVTPVFYGVPSVGDLSVSIGLLGLVVTGLGMAGLLFILATSSRPLPGVIRRCAAGRTGSAGASNA